MMIDEQITADCENWIHAVIRFIPLICIFTCGSFEPIVSVHIIWIWTLEGRKEWMRSILAAFSIFCFTALILFLTISDVYDEEADKQRVRTGKYLGR